MIKAIPMNEERPWGLGQRYMLTSTGTLTLACVQTSPISFVARGNKGNRRRLHAGNITRARDLLFARDDVARDLTRDLFLKPSCGTQALGQRGLHLSTWTIQTSLLG